MIDLLQRRRAMMGASGGSLPYDAEIEWLQGDGSAYIDTGEKGDRDTTIYIKFHTPTSGTYQCVYGSRSTNTNAITLIYTHDTSNTNRFGSQTFSKKLADDTDYEVTMSKSGCVINGTNSSYTQTSTFTTATNIQLFYAGSTSLQKFTGYITMAKIYKNDVLIFDYIPVRVGTTGYMYDRVSGELFGNAGTGDFGLGNDKN